MKLPSTKLLAQVFNDIDLSEDRYEFEQYTNMLVYIDIHDNTERYSIHDLMHIMKEWAFEKGLRNSSGVFIQDDGKKEYFCSIDKWTWHSYKSEFEVVTKACEWVLNERV